MGIEINDNNSIENFDWKNKIGILIASNNALFLVILLFGTFYKKGIYDFVVTGVLFELLWIPSLVVLFSSPFVLAYLIYKKSVRVNRLWMLLGLSLISIVLLFMLNT